MKQLKKETKNKQEKQEKQNTCSHGHIRLGKKKVWFCVLCGKEMED